MTEGLNSKNFAVTTLNMPGGCVAGATDLIFATVSNMPAVPFKFTVDSEIFLATDLDGSTYTVVGGQEGTTPADHDNGAKISVTLTSDMYMSAAPNGSEVTQTGSGLQMGRFDFDYNVTAAAAGPIALPADPVAYRDYWINDISGNFGAYPQTVQPLGFVAGQNNQNGASFAFRWLPKAQIWKAKFA